MPRKQPFTFEEFKSIYSRVPRLCADLVIKTDKGVLLTLRQKNGWEGQWHLPGGTVLYKESIHDAVNRLAEEELGIKVSIEKFLTYTEFLNEETERGFGYSVSLVFLCKPLSEVLKLDDQSEKAKYFTKPPKNTVLEQKMLLKSIGFDTDSSVIK